MTKNIKHEENCDTSFDNQDQKVSKLNKKDNRTILLQNAENLAKSGSETRMHQWMSVSQSDLASPHPFESIPRTKMLGGIIIRPLPRTESIF